LTLLLWQLLLHWQQQQQYLLPLSLAIVISWKVDTVLVGGRGLLGRGGGSFRLVFFFGGILFVALVTDNKSNHGNGKSWQLRDTHNGNEDSAKQWKEQQKHQR
jgi:hypothetical protein